MNEHGERKNGNQDSIPNRRRSDTLLWRAFPAFALMVASTAQAGTQAKNAIASAASDETITVTAQRRAQQASSIGIAITAISGDTLIEKGISSAEELWRITPGLVVKDAGYGVPNYTLRGVSFENYFVNSSSTVGLYANEVAIPYPAMSRGAFFDLERVEVLKGPQGDLYGRNTTAGQINLIDRKPTRTFAAGGVIEAGASTRCTRKPMSAGLCPKEYRPIIGCGEDLRRLAAQPVSSRRQTIGRKERSGVARTGKFRSWPGQFATGAILLDARQI
ncbi:MAG: TonB-dependent receptor [Sphingomonadales bacterium]|nr:TonB-dependent receptor [Sphingomonadales bacterium]